jgi:RPA family protein
MPEFQPRQTAFKVWIKELLYNPYVEQQGELQPNYIEIRNQRVSRINVIATVIDKQESPQLLTLTLDDGSSSIQAKAFNEDMLKFASLSIGDLLLVIGKPRKYNQQLYISLEIAKKLDPLWSKVRKIELEKQAPLSQIIQVQQENHQPVVEEVVKENNERKHILEAIQVLDQGEGTDVLTIIRETKLPENIVEEIVEDLLKDGEIYQPRPNLIKTL